MSGFHEVRFPDNIAYGATGGPEFATTVVATGGGHEKRNVNWSEARGRWDVASGLKKQAQIDELIAFFRARRGKAYGFRFKDWTDYKATGQLLGTGDDVQTQFQLVKHYPSGSVIEVRTITKPVAGTVKVYLDGVEQLSGWSVDTTTGLVTFGMAPALGRRGHRRLRVRRAGAVRYRPHGGDHRDLPAARLAADPDRRAQDLTPHFRSPPLQLSATPMPKIITPAMRAHLDEETTRLGAIWRITRKDGAQFFFTDHDRDIVFGGEIYRAHAGFERTAIRSDAGFAVDNLDLVGVFAEGGIIEDEVRAGLFDAAEIAISFVNWQDPDGHGEIRLRRGTLGETRLTPQGYFHAELRGLSQPLAQSTLEVFSPNCRADLGDHRCRFPIQPPELGRDQAVSKGAFYRVSTAAGTGSARYEDRIYEVIEAGTTASSQPAYDSTIGATTIDGTAILKAHDSFTRVAFVEPTAAGAAASRRRPHAIRQGVV